MILYQYRLLTTGQILKCVWQVYVFRVRMTFFIPLRLDSLATVTVVMVVPLEAEYNQRSIAN